LPKLIGFLSTGGYFSGVSRRNDTGIMRLIVVFIIIIAAFWLLIINFLPQKEPELVYLNETEIETVLEEPYTLQLNTYDQIKLEVQKGDVLNITVEVINGGPIDFFILEEDRVDMLIDALEGRSNRFVSYDRGKGLNITYRTTEFIIINNDDWYIFLNNYGHVQNGAFPSGKVVVRVDIKKIGFNEAGGFTMPS
jgi:hypothetical protein